MDKMTAIIVFRGEYMDRGPAQTGLVSLLEYHEYRDGAGGWISLLDIIELFVYHSAQLPRNLRLEKPILVGALDYYDFLRMKVREDGQILSYQD